MRKSPDPTQSELDESVKLAQARVEHYDSMVRMKREHMSALLAELVELREEIRQAEAALEGAKIDLSDIEAEAKFYQGRR